MISTLTNCCGNKAERAANPSVSLDEPLPETCTLQLDQFIRSATMTINPHNYYGPGDNRRYANRAGSYPPSYPERRVATGFNGYPGGPPRDPNEPPIDDMDEYSTQRKRIAVAVCFNLPFLDATW